MVRDVGPVAMLQGRRRSLVETGIQGWEYLLMSDTEKDTGILVDEMRAGQCLHNCAIQVQAAAEETQAEIDGIAELVIALAGHAGKLSRRLDQASASGDESDDIARLREDMSALDAVANKTIARLQFADQLQQRLSTVQHNLNSLADWFSAAEFLLQEQLPTSDKARAANHAWQEDGSNVCYLPSARRRPGTPD